MKTKSTDYYELLGVERSAAEQELKKAYRKKAIQLHPDKQGGDGEAFKRMKYAYDVLSDSKKRKAYDQYGEAGVKLIEGNLSPEVAMDLFLDMGSCERLLLIFLLTLVIGYLLLFPILLSIRWDHPNSMTFAHVFLPTWFGLGLVLSFCLCCNTTPVFPPPEEEEDENMRKQIEQEQQEKLMTHRAFKFGGITVTLVMALLLFLLVLRLDGETKWSYFLVIWPWIVLEIGVLAVKLWNAESAYMMAGNDPTTLKERKWLDKDWILFIVPFTAQQFCHIAFACLIASKLDGYGWTWWEVFMPFWVDYVLGIILELTNCSKVKSAAERAFMTPEAKAREETCGTISAKMILRTMWLGCVVLLCWKLEHPNSFPAFVMFLPLFITAGCFCCCTSCLICCMSSEMRKEMDGDEETGMGEAPPGYGTCPPPRADASMRPGVMWECTKCGEQNKPQREKCNNCGASKLEAGRSAS